MVKGTSRQVIVVHSPEQKIFEQAIFILKDGVVGEGITDEELLKEAKQAAGEGLSRHRRLRLSGPAWAFTGAMATGAVWLLTILL